MMILLSVLLSGRRKKERKKERNAGIWMWKMSGRDRHTMHTTVAKKFERENNKYSPFLAISQLFAAGQKEKGDFNAVRDSFNNWPNGLQFRFFISSLITYQNAWWFIFTKLIIPFFSVCKIKLFDMKKVKCACALRGRVSPTRRTIRDCWQQPSLLLLSFSFPKSGRRRRNKTHKSLSQDASERSPPELSHRHEYHLPGSLLLLPVRQIHTHTHASGHIYNFSFFHLGIRKKLVS